MGAALLRAIQAFPRGAARHQGSGPRLAVVSRSRPTCAGVVASRQTKPDLPAELLSAQARCVCLAQEGRRAAGTLFSPSRTSANENLAEEMLHERHLSRAA